MTQTSTTELAGLLGARKAEINGEAQVVDVEVIPPTADAGGPGEIVPVAAGAMRSDGGDPGGVGPSDATLAAPAPVELPIPYPTIPPKVIGGLPYAPHYAKLAKTICNTEMVPGAMRGRYDAVTAAFMRGYEMGLGPMQALDSLHVIDGKVGLTAEAMRALIMEAGHQLLLTDMQANDGTFVGVMARCHRAEWADDMWMDYAFTMDDARQAGLLRPSKSGKPTGWQTYPRAMCDARATSGAGRRYFPDVLAGMSYTPEEIRDFGPEPAPALEEVPPSPPPAPTQQPTTPTDAPAPEGSSENGPPCLDDAESTDSAPATSEEATADSAPPTPSTPPAKKARGASKKAARPPAAESAPAPEESTAPAASEEASTAAVAEHGDPGGVGVTRAMVSAYREMVACLPTAQQPVCRAYIQQHFPGQRVEELSESDVQKCINIAAGWPDSIEQYPLPEEDGQQVMGM